MGIYDLELLGEVSKDKDGRVWGVGFDCEREQDARAMLGASPSAVVANCC
jgi:hypothetical protein